jgi:hypothetical protein
MTRSTEAARLPTPEDEARFWALVESAWAECEPSIQQIRLMLAVRDPAIAVDLEGDPDLVALVGGLDGFFMRLDRAVAALSGGELLDMQRVLERKLYDLDRADVHEILGDSDDAFLYERGFVVALGRAFYDAVNRDPRIGISFAECEDMCHVFTWAYEKRFGDYPGTGSGLSIESGSNLAGWPLR